MRAYPISRERWAGGKRSSEFYAVWAALYYIFSPHKASTGEQQVDILIYSKKTLAELASAVVVANFLFRQVFGSRGLHARKSLFSSGYVGRRGDEQGRTRCQELGTSTDFPSTALNRPWLRKKSGEVSGFRITRRLLYRWWTRAKHLRRARAVSPLIAVFWHLMTLVAARTAMSRKAWL